MRGVISNWGAFVFSAVVSFFLSPFVVRSLGETQYGAWVLLGSMVGHLGLLDVGVRAAVTRYIARFHSSGEHEDARRLYSSALHLFAGLGGAAIALAGLMAVLVGHAFHVPHELVGVARIVTIVGGVGIATSLIGGVFGGVLTGLQHFETSNAIEIVVGAARAVGVVACLVAGQGLVSLSLVQLAATIALTLSNRHFARRVYPELRVVSRRWDRTSAVLLVRFGLTASALHVSSALMLYSDSLVIGAFLPVAMITHFSIGSTLINYARSVASGISQTLTPRISALEAEGQDSAIQSALLTNARFASIVVYPIAATFIFRGTSFVGLWMGPEFSTLAGKVLIILAFNLLTLAGYQIVSAAMFGIGKHVGLIPVFACEAALNILLSILLVRRFGVLGTAFGTMIPRVIVSGVIGPWYAERTLRIPLRRFWLDAFVRPAVAIAPFALASYLIDRTYPAPGLVVFFAQVVALLPLAAAADWVVCLSPSERAVVRRRFTGLSIGYLRG